MDKEQVIGLLNTVNAAYPMMTRNMGNDERKAQLILWYEVFKNDDARVVGAAVRRHILSKQFPPSIAEIRAGIREQTMPSPALLYETLVKQARKSTRDEVVAIEGDTYKVRSLKNKAYEELPAELKRYVKTPEGLKDWCREWRYDPEGAKEHFTREIKAIREEIDNEKVIGGQYMLNERR